MVVGNFWNQWLIFCLRLSTDFVCRTMSFSLKVFAENPSLVTLLMWRKSELLLLSSHYMLEITGNTRKTDILKALSQFLVDEDIISDEEVESMSEIKLKRLELQEWEREHENQLCIKELKCKERKLSIQLKMKELVVENYYPPCW